MKIYPYLRSEHVFLNIPLKSKEAVFRCVSARFASDHVVKDSQALYESMKQREATLSTGIGNGIGIPHATSREAEYPAIILLRLVDPIDFEALDGLPVDIVLALVIPENQTSLHLQILAGISRLCEKPEFLNFVRKADHSKDLLEGLKRFEDGMAFH